MMLCAFYLQFDHGSKYFFSMGWDVHMMLFVFLMLLYVVASVDVDVYLLLLWL